MKVQDVSLYLALGITSIACAILVAAYGCLICTGHTAYRALFF